METKKLGRTDVDVPIIGMGTWKLGGLHTPDYRRDQEAIESLQAGIELGLTLIDTAEMYGAGHSEELVAKAVKGVREKVFIATKVSPEHLSYEGVIKAAERSLKRLDTDYIDLYQIHIPNPAIPIAETMRAMENLADKGKIRFIGVSNFSVELLRQAQECLSKHQIVSNQVVYNLLNRRIEKHLLPFAEREHVTIMAYSPFATGYLLSSSGGVKRTLECLVRTIMAYSPLATGHPPRSSRRGKKTLEYLASKYDKTFAQICLNRLISKKAVIAIPKAINVEHLKENAGAAGWRMETEDYETIDNVFSR